MPAQHDQAVLRREVVEVAGVQQQGVDDALLDGLEAGEGMPGDDAGLLGHPDELGRQDQPGRYPRRGQRQHVGHPPAHRMPARLQKPPGSCEQDHDEPTGQMHREDTDQGQHRHRDAIAMPQRRDDQNERRDRDAVGRQVGHRRGAELDVGHRRERRRQRRGRRSHSGGVRRARTEQLPGQHRRAGRKQPHRRRHRTQGVAGRRCRAGELAVDRGQGVKHRGVVQRLMGFDVAKLAHVSGRSLAGVENEAHRVGMPDRVPGARNGLPVHDPAVGGPHDQQRAE